MGKLRLRRFALSKVTSLRRCRNRALGHHMTLPALVVIVGWSYSHFRNKEIEARGLMCPHLIY